MVIISNIISTFVNLEIHSSCYKTVLAIYLFTNCLSLIRLLYSVLPISVATELRHQRPVPARRYDPVTLLFSGIVGFANYCARNTDHKGAMKIVRMLNDLYTTFDALTDQKRNPNVYKVSF